MTSGDMTNHPPGTELFREAFDLADELAARITDDEVEARLRRLLRVQGAGGPGPSQAIPPCSPSADCPVLPDNITAGSFKLAPAEIIQQLHAAREEATRARQLAAAWAAEAEQAKREAAAARQQAQQIIDDAQDRADAQLQRAASIITDARCQAADIIADARKEAARITETVRTQAAGSSLCTALTSALWLPSTQHELTSNLAWLDDPEPEIVLARFLRRVSGRSPADRRRPLVLDYADAWPARNDLPIVGRGGGSADEVVLVVHVPASYHQAAQMTVSLHGTWRPCPVVVRPWSHGVVSGGEARLARLRPAAWTRWELRHLVGAQIADQLLQLAAGEPTGVSAALQEDADLRRRLLAWLRHTDDRHTAITIYNELSEKTHVPLTSSALCAGESRPSHIVPAFEVGRARQPSPLQLTGLAAHLSREAVHRETSG
jgi:hypothetical protein